MAGENPEMLAWFEELANNTAFVKVVGLSEKDISTRYDMELVLRFIVFLSEYGSKLKEHKSVDVFLTHVLRELIKDKKFDYEGKRSLSRRHSARFSPPTASAL